jgi:hypothetical protein
MAYTTGPYRIVRQLNFLKYSIQKSPNAKPFVVHIDRLKKYEGDTPESWRRIIEREKSSYSETVLDVTQNHAPQGIVTLAEKKLLSQVCNKLELSQLNRQQMQIT